jgi:hypothetical protein
MDEGQAALANSSALIMCLQAIIQGLPPGSAATALDKLRKLAPHVEAIANGTSMLPDDALELQKATIAVMIKSLEQRVANG